MDETCQESGPQPSVAELNSRYRRISDLYHCLADPNRLRILLAMVEESQTVGQISKRHGFSLAMVSHHIALMRAHRIVEGDRDGRQNFYHLTERGRFLMGPVPGLLDSALID